MDAKCWCRPLLAAVVAAALLPNGLHGQTYWRVPTTVGYGALGLGVGILSVGDVPLDDEAVLFSGMLAGLSTGAVIGYHVGKRADDALANGRDPGAGHRLAVRAGTVLTGSALGAMMAVVLINPDGPSPLASDEAIFAGSVLLGTVAGLLAQHAWDRQLRPSAVQGAVGIGSGRLAIGLRVLR